MSYHKFITDLKSAGVVIVGESILDEKVREAPNWTTVLVELIPFNREHGIRFVCGKRVKPKQVHNIVVGYPFSPIQAEIVVKNFSYSPETRYVVRDKDGHIVHETNSRVVAWFTWLLQRSNGATAHDRFSWIEDEKSWLRCGDLPRDQRPDFYS